MPLQNAPLSPRYRGWFMDQVNGTLEAYYNGTRVFAATGSAITLPLATSTVGITSASGGITATTGDITATAGNVIATAGDARITAGNVRLGAISAFATTEPTSAIVFKQGTAPVGAITTSGGVFTSGTVVRKIIADGTASNVET